VTEVGPEEVAGIADQYLPFEFLIRVVDVHVPNTQ
jgi:hypothetical protein